MSVTQILGGLAGLVFLAAGGLQLYSWTVVAGAAYEVDRAMAEAEAEFNNPPAGEFNVVNVKDDRMLWDGYEALIKVGEPVRERAVSFNAYVRLKELLKPGEDAPDRDFLEVFASARATAYADAECTRLLVKLASQCAVDSATASPVRGEKDVFLVNGRLTFVQKDEFGTAEEGALAYREVKADFTDGKPVSVAPAGAAKQRQKYYDQAAVMCAKLRKTQGNCAVYQLIINTNERDGSDALNMSGFARFSFLQPVGSS